MSQSWETLYKRNLKQIIKSNKPDSAKHKKASADLADLRSKAEADVKKNVGNLASSMGGGR